MPSRTTSARSTLSQESSTASKKKAAVRAKSQEVAHEPATAQRFIKRSRPPRVQIAYDVLTPENVAMVVSLIGAAVGAAMAAIKGIEAWMSQRANRKIKIRYKDLEIELSGALSEEEIDERIRAFEKLQGRLEQKHLKIELSDEA